MATHVPEFDVVKGFLIVLVFVGHLVNDPMNPVSYAIFSFVMPLFLGLSGFFTVRERVQAAAWVDTLRSLSVRYVFPYVVAGFLYLSLRGKNAFDVFNYVFPQSFLWFLWVLVLLKVFVKLVDTRPLLWAAMLSAFVLVFSEQFFEVAALSVGFPTSVVGAVSYSGFFLLGYLIRNFSAMRDVSKWLYPALFLRVVSFFAFLAFVGSPRHSLLGYSFMLFNNLSFLFVGVFVIFYVLKEYSCLPLNGPYTVFFQRIGENSLVFYLGSCLLVCS